MSNKFIEIDDRSIISTEHLLFAACLAESSKIEFQYPTATFTMHCKSSQQAVDVYRMVIDKIKQKEDQNDGI